MNTIYLKDFTITRASFVINPSLMGALDLSHLPPDG